MPTFLTVYIVSVNFNTIAGKLLNFTAKHNYKISKMQSRGLIKSLYIRELKRYFASSIYVTNTVIGPILGTIASVSICFIDIDTVKMSLPLNVNVNSIAPFVFSAIFTMMTTTSVSISMEGKQFWVVKSLPIPAKALLDSKVLLNLSLMLPFYTVSQVALCIALKPNAVQLIWQILVPILIMLFVTVFGITVNLKFHSFDWEKEETVVKQSLPAALGGFAGFFLCIILGAVVFAVPSDYENLAKAVICLVLLTVTAALYKNNIRKNLAEL